MPESRMRTIGRTWPGVLLGAAMGLGNALGYVVVLLLSRTLGPADFGGYSALSTYGVLLAIPAGAFQVVIARRIGAPTKRTSGVALAAAISMTLFAVTCVAAPVLRTTFHLASTWSVILLGAMLIPMTLTGCLQGILLGHRRIKALSILYVVTAFTRLLAAVAARVWSLDVRGVFAAMLVAAAVTMLTGGWLCRVELRTLEPHARGLGYDLATSNVTLAAFIGLINVDVLLARHYLQPHVSGGYALASTFGRAICWGTQFIALLIVPRMAHRNATRTLLRASALVLGVGVIGLIVVAAAPAWWIAAAGGAQYRSFASVAVACVIMGIAWALAQVWLFAEMGSTGARLGILTWAVTALECVAIVVHWHHTPMQIVGVATTGAVIVAIAGFLQTWRRHQSLATPTEESALAVATVDRP